MMLVQLLQVITGAKGILMNPDPEEITFKHSSRDW
jgi:hypothetical protein